MLARQKNAVDKWCLEISTTARLRHVSHRAIIDANVNLTIKSGIKESTHEHIQSLSNHARGQNFQD